MPGLLKQIWRGLKWTIQLIWQGMKDLMRVIFPPKQPQMQQFVGTALVTGGITAFVLKSLVIAIPLAGGTYYVGNWIGQWQGDYKGYRRAINDVKKENDALNARIATLNEELDAKHRSDEAESAERTEAIGRSLAEISPEQRKQCSASCGLPKSVKAQIEGIQ